MTVNARRGGPNTHAKPGITFAMLELANPADCNRRRGQWKRYKFKDVTPILAKRSRVPSLNGSQVATGRKVIAKLEDVVADWYMLSGHHGRLFAEDTEIYNRPNGTWDSDAYYDKLEYAGFFNNDYHHGPWIASRAIPTSEKANHPR